MDPADTVADDELARPAPSVVEQLVANHRELLAYVQRRVGDRALAEDILQDAFVRGLDKGDQIRDSAIGWMYRVLRNAVIDRQRRDAVAARRLATLAADFDDADPSVETRDAICACVSQIARTLKPEYADALRRVEVEGVAVKDYATEVGISSNNAAARVSRARAALRTRLNQTCGTCAEHGCLDCTCKPPKT